MRERIPIYISVLYVIRNRLLVPASWNISLRLNLQNSANSARCTYTAVDKFYEDNVWFCKTLEVGSAYASDLVCDKKVLEEKIR